MSIESNGAYHTSEFYAKASSNRFKTTQKIIMKQYHRSKYIEAIENTNYRSSMALQQKKDQQR